MTTSALQEQLVDLYTELDRNCGTIYLLHFEQPFKHARHYMGWASKLEERLYHHEQGTGANLLRHVKAAGISWELVRTWNNVDRNEERRMKNMGGLARVCPLCQAEAKVQR
jgi:predicted GIY-YIG superfamily endonuclease